MGKSLYRSYRSRNFDEIIGQDHIVTILKNTLNSDSINHAYLLSGPRGVGKTSTARILAHAVNGFSYEGENLNLDIIEIDAASNRRIDEVREIRDKVNIAPVSGKYKVYIIDEVHMLTKEAFNALLKTLEEPPAHAIFILATTEKHKVPETILSRCIKLNFKPIDKSIITKHLQDIAKKEKIDINTKAIDLLSEQANGSFRDAISLLEQAKHINTKIDENDVVLMLGMANKQILDQIIHSVQSSNIKELYRNLEIAYESGVDEATLASQLSKKFREYLVDEISDFSSQQLIEALKSLLLTIGSNNPRLELELALVKLMTKPENNPNTEEKISETKIKNEVKKTFQEEVTIHNDSDTRKIVEKNEVLPINKEKERPIEKVDENVSVGSNIWDDFLSELKKRNSTLYGIVRMAEISDENNLLKLNFKFPFHYKQAKEAKNQQIFNEILNGLGLANTKIDVSLKEKNTQIPSKKNDSFKNISNIFGGHEVLES